MATYSLHLTERSAHWGRKRVWELPVRICHWVMAASIATLFTTGLYISWPVFTSNGEAFQHFVMGRFRQIHFIAGYALLFSFLLRAYWFFKGNNYARSGVPLIWRASWWKALGKQLREYLAVVRGPVRLGHNSLAGLSYFIFVGMLGLAQIVTGFALYGEVNPGGFWDTLFGWVIPLLGGSFQTHMWHHTLAWGFVIFVILHLYIVIFDSIRYRNGLISSMVSGDKFFEEGDLDTDDWAS
jgi:Ni/Fe-hydrogenase 1 B-type cytochrome subunit